MVCSRNDSFYINAIEDNLFKFSLELGKNPRGEIYDGDDIKWVYTGGLTNNRIFPQKLEENNVDEKISSVMSKFRGWNVKANIYVCTSAFPRDIKEHLENQGVMYSRKWAGMAADLREYSHERPEIPGFTIIEANDSETLEIWGIVSGKSFGTPEGVMEDHIRIIKQAGANEKLKFYLGLLNGVPVGTCCLYVDGEIGGLYWVGTLPEARGRKIATAMVLHTLDKAVSMGCSASILQASEMGKGVYLKIGFKEYCQIDIYVDKG